MLRQMTRQIENMRVTPLGFCLRVNCERKPLNLEKTTSSVISIIVINRRLKGIRIKKRHTFLYLLKHVYVCI